MGKPKRFVANPVYDGLLRHTFSEALGDAERLMRQPGVCNVSYGVYRLVAIVRGDLRTVVEPLEDD